MHQCDVTSWPLACSYPDFALSLQGPQLIILVPTKELGVQQALLAFQLLGGSINRGIPGNRANLFTYTGPRGIQVCLPGLADSTGMLRARAEDSHSQLAFSQPDNDTAARLPSAVLRCKGNGIALLRPRVWCIGSTYCKACACWTCSHRRSLGECRCHRFCTCPCDSHRQFWADWHRSGGSWTRRRCCWPRMAGPCAMCMWS